MIDLQSVGINEVAPFSDSAEVFLGITVVLLVLFDKDLIDIDLEVVSSIPTVDHVEVESDGDLVVGLEILIGSIDSLVLVSSTLIDLVASKHREATAGIDIVVLAVAEGFQEV